VAGGVEEGDAPPVDLRLVRADVLRDPARFGLDDRSLTDRIQQRRLPVVDVAHDRDDRRPRCEVGLFVVEGSGLELFLGSVLDRDLAFELRADQLDLLVGERLRRRPHLPEAHQDLDELGHRDAESLGQVFDGDARLDRDGPGRGRRGCLTRLRRGARPVARLATGAAAAPALDDDTPLAPAGASAGANGAIRSFASVSHV
jgi:hypothetical protein